MEEREFELINIIGRQLGSNQRDLAIRMDLSLGMINMLIRRLISKGYIRIEQLNKRKVEYILTPKGFAEKMRQSVKYTLNTINSIGLIKDRVMQLMVRLYDEGHRSFYVYSESDLTLIIEKAFHEAEFKDAKLVILKTLPEYELDGPLLIGKENVENEHHNTGNRYDLITEVARENDLVYSGR